MKNKNTNIGLWILAAVIFLMAIYAISNGGVVAFLLFGITGIFVSPLWKKIFEGRKLANLKKSRKILIAIGLFCIACLAMPATKTQDSDTSDKIAVLMDTEHEIATEDNLDIETEVPVIETETLDTETMAAASETEMTEKVSEVLQEQEMAVNSLASANDATVDSANPETDVDSASVAGADITSDTSAGNASITVESTPAADTDAGNTASAASDVSAAGDTVVVHITNTGEKYHSAGCQYLKESDIEITLADAKAQGYTPCSKCNPPQ